MKNNELAIINTINNNTTGNNATRITFKAYTFNKDDGYTVSERDVLIPDSIGSKSVNADTVVNNLHCCILCDLENAVYKAYKKWSDEKNKESTDIEKIKKYESDYISINDFCNVYKKAIDYDNTLVLSDDIELLITFLVIPNNTAINISDSYAITEKIVRYYNNYFNEPDEIQGDKRVELKKDIINFINSKLEKTSTNFRIDKIDNKTLKHIVSSVCQPLKMTKNGVNSIDLPTTTTGIQRLERHTVHQILMSTVGIKTGYLKKIKDSNDTTTTKATKTF